jgi:ketosteroid isomerase-like protein
MKSIALCCALAFLTSASTAAEHLSVAEREVWEYEEAYCRYLNANDLNGFMSLWHPNFNGWPSTEAAPVGKSKVRDIIASYGKMECQMAHPTVKVFGNTAIAYYELTLSFKGKDDKPETRVLKVTHTWLRTDALWEIIGGMSAPLPSPGQ